MKEDYARVRHTRAASNSVKGCSFATASLLLFMKPFWQNRCYAIEIMYIGIACDMSILACSTGIIAFCTAAHRHMHIEWGVYIIICMQISCAKYNYNISLAYVNNVFHLSASASSYAIAYWWNWIMLGNHFNREWKFTVRILSMIRKIGRRQMRKHAPRFMIFFYCLYFFGCCWFGSICLVGCDFLIASLHIQLNGKYW